MNWEAITAISTLFMMIATFFIALIALQAKNTWKKEIRQNKIHSLAREYFDILKDVECLIEYKDTYEELELFDKIWINFKKLGTLNLELALINKKSQYNFLNDKIFSLIDEYTNNNLKVNNKFIKCNGAKDFMNDEQAQKEMLLTIKNSKGICVEHIQKFYNN